jgi:hypothetical protein
MDFPADLSPEELTAQVKKAVQLNEPIILKTYTFPHEMEAYVEQVLTLFLEEVRQECLKDNVIYFVKELMVNAKKANTKRIYFIEKSLDINKMEDYRQGMKDFKSETLDNIGHYLALQEKQGLFVELRMGKKEGHILIEVLNNAVITPIEEIRMTNKIKTGKKYSSLEDVLSETVDDTEGSGLGLIILMLMMKKMGIGQKFRSILIEKRDGNTVVGVKIPLKHRMQNLNRY